MKWQQMKDNLLDLLYMFHYTQDILPKLRTEPRKVDMDAASSLVEIRYLVDWSPGESTEKNKKAFDSNCVWMRFKTRTIGLIVCEVLNCSNSSSLGSKWNDTKWIIFWISFISFCAIFSCWAILSISIWIGWKISAIFKIKRSCRNDWNID